MAWNPRSWAMQKRKLGLLGLLPRIGHAPSIGDAQSDIGDIPGMVHGWREKLFPGGALHSFPGPDPLPPLVPFFPHDREPGKFAARKGVISKEPTYPWLIHRDPVVRGENVPSVPAITEKPPMQKTYPNTGPPGWAPRTSSPSPTHSSVRGGPGSPLYGRSGPMAGKKGLSMENMIKALTEMKKPPDQAKAGAWKGGEARPQLPGPAPFTPVTGVNPSIMNTGGLPDARNKKWWEIMGYGR